MFEGKILIRIICMYLTFNLLLLPGFNIYASEGNSINLMNSQQISDARAVSDAINIMSNKVTKCIENKLVLPEKCFCLYPKEFLDFKSKYKQAINNNPEWDGKIVSYQSKDNYSGQSLSFVGLKTQANMQCN